MSDTAVKTQKNIFHVIKRTGETTLFDEDKLSRSIMHALRAAHIQEQPLAHQIVGDVLSTLSEELSYREHISTLDVREAVEIAMLERGLTTAAGKYHDFVSSQDTATTSDSEDSEKITRQDKEPAKKSQTKTTPKKTISQNSSSAYNKKDADEKEIKQATPNAVRIAAQNEATTKKLSDERTSVTYRFQLQGCRGYVTVSLFDDGSPAEILLHSVYDVDRRDVRVVHFFLSVVSAALQHGVPLPALLTNLTAAQEQLNLLEDDAFGYVLLRHLCTWLTTKFAN